MLACFTTRPFFIEQYGVGIRHCLVIINKGDKGKWDRVSFEWGALPDYFSSCWSSGRSFSASERRAPPIFVLLAGIVVVVVVHLQPVGLLRQLLVGGDVLGRPGSSGPHL